MDFPDWFEKGFITQEFLDKITALGLEYPISSFVKNSKLVDIASGAGIDDKEHRRLRFLAYWKYDKEHGIETLKNPVRGKVRIAQEYFKEHGDSIDPNNLQELLISQIDYNEEVNYYLGVYEINRFETAAFRVEAPLLFKFNDEMLSTFHESYLQSKKIIKEIEMSADDAIALTIIRSCFESAALFLYSFWDRLTQKERESVVPAFMHLAGCNNRRLVTRRRKVEDAWNIVKVFSNLSRDPAIKTFDLPETNADEATIQRFMNTDRKSGFGLLYPMASATMNKSNMASLIKNIDKSVKNGNSPSVSALFAIQTESYLTEGYNYNPEVEAKIGVVNCVLFADRGYSAAKAVEWVEAGFWSVEADKFYDLGILDPTEALKIRNLPDSWASGWNA